MKENIYSLFIIIISLFLTYLISSGSINFFDYKSVYVLWLLIFIIHILVFIPSYIYQTEHYYDLTGGITFVSSVLFLLIGRYFYFNSIDNVSLVVSLLVSIWTIRLSSFLFLRVKKVGKDVRFTEIKKDFKRFLFAFLLSGFWVFMCLLPTTVIMTSSVLIEFNILIIFGIILWLIGFVFEVVADVQKTEFNKKNKGKFISSGLWSLSRHPNYFGEFTLWTGLAIISISFLNGVMYVVLLSPIFIYFLLNKVSGVNLLEEIGEKRWGSKKEYQDYKKNTPVFFPKLF
ncbi:MAG: hypothetical protein CMB84_01680 [Flammeovirgaceae bacterium]|nr:hypothetical protein [Flammeovirgaceae bacterium]